MGELKRWLLSACAKQWNNALSLNLACLKISANQICCCQASMQARGKLAATMLPANSIWEIALPTLAAPRHLTYFSVALVPTASALQDKFHLYFLFDLMPGGDLMDVLVAEAKVIKFPIEEKGVTTQAGLGRGALQHSMESPICLTALHCSAACVNCCILAVSPTFSRSRRA